MSEAIEEKFTTELEKVVDYFRSEFDITYAQAIGSLQIIVFDLYMEARECDDDECVTDDG